MNGTGARLIRRAAARILCETQQIGRSAVGLGQEAHQRGGQDVPAEGRRRDDGIGASLGERLDLLAKGLTQPVFAHLAEHEHLAARSD